MRRIVAFPLLALGFFLFGWIHLPKQVSDQLRYLATAPFRHRSVQEVSCEAHLRWENQQLRTQIERLCEWVGDERIAYKLLGESFAFLPAQVVYRNPNAWSSSLWVNVGDEDNLTFGRLIVAKNSPVLAEGALVGVVEYVGKKQARVRLITDSGLSPSVRVCRGAIQNRQFSDRLQSLLDLLENRSDLFSAEGEKQQLLAQLHRLKGQTGAVLENGYFARGEVHGSSAPFWRSRRPILKGIGFHCDFEENPSRDFKAKVPILKEGDLLVTSGLDGVFPPDLRIGTVMRIAPLKEGSSSYDIEVRPAVSRLNDLQTLMILPPLGE